MRGSVTALFTLALILSIAACGGGGGDGNSAPTTPAMSDEGAPRVVSVSAPRARECGSGEVFIYSAEAAGPEVDHWFWELGPGSSPQISVSPRPIVILHNHQPSEADADYSGRVTVWDNEGRASTTEFNYSVAYRAIPQTSFGELPETFTNNGSNGQAEIEFTVNLVDEREAVVELSVLEGDGVSVYPKRIAIDYFSGYRHRAVLTNSKPESRETVLRLAIITQHGCVNRLVRGPVPGKEYPAGSIAVIPSECEVSVGDTFEVVVYITRLPVDALHFAAVEVYYTEGVAPVMESWNLGEPGGGQWEKDGITALIPQRILAMNLEDTESVFIHQDMSLVAVGICSITNGVEDPQPVPAGSSGALFNLKFQATEAGTAKLWFREDCTFVYSDDTSTPAPYTQYIGAEVTVNP
jgi:hypothetical protein